MLAIHKHKKEKLFIESCKNGDINEVSKLIQRQVNINCQDKFGYTGLMHASMKGHYEIVKLLICRGAQLDVVDGKGYTALSKTVYYDKPKILKLLINAGANLNVQNTSGRTALMLVAMYGNNKSYDDVAKLLVSNGADTSPIDKWGKQAKNRSINPKITKILK